LLSETTILSGFVCPTLNVANATLNTSAVTFKTTVKVTCPIGFVVYPLQISPANIDCLNNGKWSSYPITCESRKNLLRIFLLWCHAI
jgi:hypothetical protein